MKGIIFNLLEEYVTERARGEADVWENILAGCTLKTERPLAIVGPGTYPDEDFSAMVAGASRFFSISEDTLLNSFGTHILPVLAGRYPHFFAAFHDPKSFLKHVGLIHQTEIKKLYRDAETPFFGCQEKDGVFVLSYSSKRRLGELVKGLLTGLGTYYSCTIRIMNTACEKRESRYWCEFILEFEEGL